MTTKTIPQLDPATLPVDNASLMEISIPGGGSRKLALSDLTPNLVLPFFGLNPLPWQRPALATFSTWLNRVDSIGGGTEPTTATADDGAGGLPLVVTGGRQANTPNGAFPTGIFKSIGAPPWTITVAFAGMSIFPYANSLGFYPIMLYDSVDQKALALQWEGYPQSIVQVRALTNVNDLTTIDDSAESANYGFPWSDYFAWFRVENDGTNLTWSISPEGVLFKPFFIEPVGAFLGTIDKVGFGMNRASSQDNANLTNSSSILWGWVET